MLPILRFSLSLPAVMLWAASIAQPHAIGSTTRTFFDPVRSRNIPCEIYYPGQSAGADVAVAVGAFPVLVIGHGFVMTVDAYTYLWEHFVPLGYIVVLPTTEGGFAPSHTEFGADLAYAVEAIQLEDADATSLFFGSVAPTSALLGHSMGGGASLLGAANNAAITTVVNFAAAETSPSAVAAAAQVLKPALLFAGSADCVTPPATNQQPMYDALTVSCKALVTITGGGHCHFGDANVLCSLGELTCGAIPLARPAQQDVVTDLSTLWLDHHLKGDSLALFAFLDSMSASARIVSQFECLSTAVVGANWEGMCIGPVPADQEITLAGVPGLFRVSVMDTGGRPWSTAAGSGTIQVPTASLPAGVYLLRVESGDMVRTQRVVVMHP